MLRIPQDEPALLPRKGNDSQSFECTKEQSRAGWLETHIDFRHLRVQLLDRGLELGFARRSFLDAHLNQFSFNTSRCLLLILPLRLLHL